MTDKDIEIGCLLKEEIRKNFEARLADCTQGLDQCLKDDFSKTLTLKLLELWQLNRSEFCGLFRHISRWNGLDTIEGMEKILSFIGNFYDDATFELVTEVPDHILDADRSYNNFRKQRVMPEKHFDYENDPSYKVIKWSSDDCPNPLDEPELLKLLDDLMASIKEYDKKCQEWEQKKKEWQKQEGKI